MSVVTNILAILGIILVIVIIVYMYRKYDDDQKKKKTPPTPTFPPSEYMREVGTKCPDLWSLSTTYQSGKYKCENTGNAPVSNDDGKFNCAKNAVFSQMEKWPLKDKKRQKELATRCQWIEKCGPSKGTPASWIGIDDLC